jgi:hypothetical protein
MAFSFLIEDLAMLQHFLLDERNSTLVLGVLLVVFCLCAVLLVARFVSPKKKTLIADDGTTKKKPKTRGPICPYSKDSAFIVEAAEHLKETPLDMFADWATTTDSKKPLAARWLAAGLSGQDTPRLLRAGLKRLRNAKHFLVVEPHRIQEELLLKKKALDDPKRNKVVFVAEKDSLEAQRECLELLVDYLPKRYPDLYQYHPENKTIFVQSLETTFCVKDWWETRPLELCERIVQEDLILMRPGAPVSDKGHESYFMAAAAVVFSFGELVEKLGQPAEIIHAPVPGFEKHLRKTLNMSFSRLTPEQPLWRNNWGIAPSGSLDEPLYGSTTAQEERSFADISLEEIKAKFLKVEYQTIRRLPRTKYLLFTVKTMVDPLDSLQRVPEAAVCLAHSIRGMSPGMRAYKGIQDDATALAVLAYLDSISPKIPNT